MILGPYHYGDKIFITQIYKFNELFLNASYADFWSTVEFDIRLLVNNHF